MLYQTNQDKLPPAPPGGRIDETGTKYVVIVEMYDAYRVWCDRQGEEPETYRKFFKKLSIEIPDYENRLKRKNIGGKEYWVIMRWKLKSQQML